MGPDCIIIHITSLPNHYHNNKTETVEFPELEMIPVNPLRGMLSNSTRWHFIIFYTREILAVTAFIPGALKREEGIFISLICV